MAFRKFYPFSFAEEIEKAIRFIKVMQFQAGFPEITRPHLGGEIEVSIEPDDNDGNIFHIMFRFLAIPGDQIILQEYRQVTYQELRHFASEYDKNKDKIDLELSIRE